MAKADRKLIASAPNPTDATSLQSPTTLADAAALQAIEGNPLTADEIAMFEMFDRENWPFEKRRIYILESIRAETSACLE